jgi:hypothetical protein
LARSPRSASRWELTDTYSPTAIDIAPATRPATPTVITVARDAFAAATPTSRLAIDTMPSSAPSTAARSHPARPPRWRSRWGTHPVQLDNATLLSHATVPHVVVPFLVRAWPGRRLWWWLMLPCNRRSAV